MKYFHFYLKIIIPVACACLLLLSVAECLKHGQYATGIASLIIALSQFLQVYFEHHKHNPNENVAADDNDEDVE